MLSDRDWFFCIFMREELGEETNCDNPIDKL